MTDKTPFLEQEAFAKLVDRIGPAHAGRRLEMQAHYSALLLHGYHIHVHMEEFPVISWLLKTGLCRATNKRFANSKQFYPPRKLWREMQ